MDILVTGGTGFIGQALLPALEEQGHEVLLLSRQAQPCAGRYRSVQSLDALPADTSLDAVINLAGASLAGKRWNDRYKRELVASRVDTTRALLDLFGRLERPPHSLLSASAIGYYGHHGDEPLDEQGQVVPGFAQALCAEWEAVAGSACELGVRTCLLRLGVVLDSGGGALAQMAAPFRLGVANYVGDGSQWLSWVHRTDVVSAILHLLEDRTLAGPFNLTAPEPVTAKQFCAALKAHHTTLLTLPMPAPAMRLLVGEMAEELLISGQRVVPRALQDAGFRFAYPGVKEALAAVYAA